MGRKFSFLKFFYFFIVGLLFSACAKDKAPTPPGYGGFGPRLQFISVTPSSVKQFSDSLVFQISYRDSDGDLGENNPSAFNLFLLDKRVNVTYQYRIPQLAPTGSNITITGLLDLVLAHTAITDGSTSQKAVFGIYAKDRAGNVSDTVSSTEITITE